MVGVAAGLRGRASHFGARDAAPPEVCVEAAGRKAAGSGSSCSQGTRLCTVMPVDG